MLVSISIGSKSRAVINTLKVSADNFDFATFSSMKELIKSATLRHISFDRIVFSSEILNPSSPEKDLEDLHEFITNYSNQTELVFIIKGSSELENNLDKVFCSMFNSPMYTPVIMKKASAQTLLEIIQDDITELKTRYYVLQDKEDRVITSASSEKEKDQDGKPDTVERNVPEKKKGFLGRVFGTSAKKEALLKEIASAEKKDYNSVRDSGENDALENPDMSTESMFTATGNIEENATNEPVGNIKQKNIFGGVENGAVSVGVENLNSGFSEVASEDELLSIGEFGERHSDTGFLDNDDEEELKMYAESRDDIGSGSENQDAGNSEEEEDFYGFTPDFDTDAEELVENVEEPAENIVEPVLHIKEEPLLKVNTDKSKSNIDLIVSVKGSGATQSIVDESVKMVEEDNLKVLIIDLDLKENGILSYIDTERFYMTGSNYGISKMRIFEEDGVGVVSNGYGVPLSRRTLANFLLSRVIRKYDMIFIDCPTDSLKLFDYELISRCNVLVMSGNDRSDLLSTTLALTNRNLVEYDVERYIAENCVVEFTKGSYKVEDVTWLNSICLFANGNWLSRIDV